MSYKFFYLLLNSIPAFFILLVFILREKNKEPLSIVLSTFALTYIIVLPLDLLISIADPLIEESFKNQHFHSFEDFFRAAFLEEILKFSVFFLFIYKHTNFDELSDGIIYGIAVGLGYAVVENYDYLVGYYMYKEPMKEFVQDRWWALLGHVSLGIIMGMFLAKSRIKKFNKKIMLSLALCLPIFLHGLHNYTFDSETLYQSYVDYYIFALDVLVIVGSFIVLPKLETIKLEIDDTSNIYKDYVQIFLIGLTFAIILAILFGFIS